ncbi:AsnC family transcriptional regulator [Methanomassiliicoccus luminyensis]|uniref:AsnC family transcriptional regulator n=1 Tax=Methanomassiliicoccus luminyensis TaxID=1080712 RepID=UPI00037C9A37|nr:AsnC family transcriptional regulator [Methanomassiliicoccus luminyensis]
MDETDILIIKELAVDPRRPYRDLADRLSLSVNGVHKRIQQLIAKGIIMGFRTRLAPQVTGGGFLNLYGRSTANDFLATMERIGEHECTSRIVAAGGQFLYVDAWVRSHQEMLDYQAFVRNVGRIDDLRALAMVMIGQPPAKDPLTRTDYRIVKALWDDCRRPLQDVAKDVGSTAKTVKRRLEALEEQKFVYYMLDGGPCSSGGLTSIVHAKLKRGGRSLQDAALALFNSRNPHILGVSASNVEPDLLLLSMWARDLKELRDAEASLNANEDFESLYSNLFYDMRLYPTWMDKLISDRSK